MRRGCAALAATLGVLGPLAIAGNGAAAVPNCASFAFQAEAQEAFLDLGGRPGDDVGGLDGNGNGVACESLSGPYAGYATIGFNRRRGFLYGIATLPRTESGYQCLLGNRFEPDTARRLNIYRELPGADKAILDEPIGTAADQSSGKLVWKAVRPNLPSGRYYAAFEARIKTSPYGRNQCPSFASRPTLLPAPKKNR